MKKLKSLVFIALFLMTFSTQAQLSVNIHFGTPPVWAPENRVEVQYYYLPEIDSYYDVPSAQFIYINDGRWIRSRNLPYRYRNYNLRGGNVIYLNNYKGNSPYRYHNQHREQYNPHYRSEYNHNEGHGNEGHGNENDNHNDNGNQGNNGNHGNNGHGNGKKNR